MRSREAGAAGGVHGGRVEDAGAGGGPHLPGPLSRPKAPDWSGSQATWVLGGCPWPGGPTTVCLSPVCMPEAPPPGLELESRVPEHGVPEHPSITPEAQS